MFKYIVSMYLFFVFTLHHAMEQNFSFGENALREKGIFSLSGESDTSTEESSCSSFEHSSDLVYQLHRNNEKYLDRFPANIINRNFNKPVLECFCIDQKDSCECYNYKQYHKYTEYRLNYLIEDNKIDLLVCTIKDKHSDEECLICNDKKMLFAVCIKNKMIKDKNVHYLRLRGCKTLKRDNICFHDKCLKARKEVEKIKKQTLDSIKKKGFEPYLSFYDISK